MPWWRHPARWRVSGNTVEAAACDSLTCDDARKEVDPRGNVTAVCRSQVGHGGNFAEQQPASTAAVFRHVSEQYTRLPLTGWATEGAGWRRVSEFRTGWLRGVRIIVCADDGFLADAYELGGGDDG